MSNDSAIGGGVAAPWYRVVAIPDAPFGGTAERDYASVLPALLDAAKSRRPFVVGWFSRGGGAPLELFTNAGPLPPPHGADAGPRAATAAQHPYGPPSGSAPGHCELLFPWGARGVPLADGLMSDLDRMIWAPCLGRQAPPLSGEPASDSRGQSAGRAGSWLGTASGMPGGAPTLFETALTTLMERPFGWLVVAEPTDLIDVETAALRGQLNAIRRFDEERSRFEADRMARRLAELDAFAEAGLWNVRVLVGAADPEQLNVVAPMLVGAVDLTSHPYRLRGTDRPMDLADALTSMSGGAADHSAVPFAATAGVLAALAALPRREVPGVRVLDVGYFDVTAELTGDHGVSLGTILDGKDRHVGQLSVPLATLNRHALVTGATGSGKSQTVRYLLDQLTRAGIPWLVVEPVKSEYASIAGRIAEAGADLTVINPSDPDAVPLAVNPLSPEPGYPVQAHIDMVRALFLAAFDAREPFPQIMSQALQRV